MSADLETDVFDLKDHILANNAFGPQDVIEIQTTIAGDYSHFGGLRDAINELKQDDTLTPAARTKLGCCLYLQGQFAEAMKMLQNADGGALALFYQGRCQFQTEQYEEAIATYEKAKKSGYDEDQCKLGIAEAHRYARRLPDSMSILDDMFGPVEQTADYLYQRAATVAAIGEDRSQAINLYERAVGTDENHAGALFGLAAENDRAGNDGQALQLYERAANAFPTGVGALLNLGLIYEDSGRYDRAQACYKRILDIYPGHQRATLYMRDASAQGNVLYDEETQRRNDRLAQVLNLPVSNFELSVRSRNCLTKMGIETLGDLTQTTESELLSSKNFGETSLFEIREILGSKGLSLGQFAHEKKTNEPPIDTSHMSADEKALLDRPISDLNLSVRARKCMVRLGLNTIGELIRRTPDDMLECKNFGVTSLNEVREKLSDLGLKLRGE